MGRVYEAEDTHLERRVAIKVLPIEYSEDPGFRERFLREARLAASLNHPNLVAVYDAGESQDSWGPYLVMELVEGQSLRDLLMTRGPCRAALAALP